MHKNFFVFNGTQPPQFLKQDASFFTMFPYFIPFNMKNEERETKQEKLTSFEVTNFFQHIYTLTISRNKKSH